MVGLEGVPEEMLGLAQEQPEPGLLLQDGRQDRVDRVVGLRTGAVGGHVGDSGGQAGPGRVQAGSAPSRPDAIHSSMTGHTSGTSVGGSSGQTM